MKETIDMSKLSKVDELSVRKTYVEKMLKNTKEHLESKAMLLLAGAFDDNAEDKAIGQVVFIERWLEDIDNEIKSL